MSFWDKAGDFVKNQQEDIRSRRKKFERLSDDHSLDKFSKATSVKDKVAMKLILQERGLLDE